jgi:stage V sporulation protein K
LHRVLDSAKRGERFGNARFARTLFEQALNAQALRLEGRLDEVGPEELSLLTGADVADAARTIGEELPRRGFWRR